MIANRLNILITGGLGFIGSNLAIRLIKEGHKVTIVDNLFDAYGGNKFNLKDFEDKCKIFLDDIRNENSIKDFVKNKDVIFNLAGQIGHQRSMLKPFEDLDINVKAQLNLLEAVRKIAPEVHIIYTSTRQIYGKPNYLPVDELHNINPVDINGINKFTSEKYHELYNKIFNIKSTILRLTNTFGPRMRIKDANQTFVGYWIRNSIINQPISIYGDGKQIRDFNYVDDVVDALLMCINNKKIFGKTINIGSEDSFTLKELANQIKEIIPNLEINYIPFPKEKKLIDIGNYYSNISLARQLLMWEPVTDLKQGLNKTLDFYLRYYKNYI